MALAGELALDELVIMGDGLVGGRWPRWTVADLAEAVRAATGRVGAAKLRAALELIRPGTDSAKETELRLLVVRAGLPEPVVNLPIRDASGRVVAHGDLGYEAERLLLEYDGGQHRTDDRQFAIDIRRLDDLMAMGWRVIRVDKHLLAAPPLLLARIRQALRRAR